MKGSSRFIQVQTKQIPSNQKPFESQYSDSQKDGTGITPARNIKIHLPKKNIYKKLQFITIQGAAARSTQVSSAPVGPPHGCTSVAPCAVGSGCSMVILLVRFAQGMDGNGGCWDYHENNYEMDHSLIPDLKHQ